MVKKEDNVVAAASNCVTDLRIGFGIFLIVTGQWVACAIHANVSSALALVLGRLEGVLLSACVILLILHLFCTQFVHILHLTTLLDLCTKAETQKHNTHWTHIVACFPPNNALC